MSEIRYHNRKINSKINIKQKKKKLRTNDDNENFIDFLTDNLDNFTSTTKDLMSQSREIWNIIPDLVYDIFLSILTFFTKIVMKVRSNMAVALTSDIDKIEKYTVLYLEFKNKDIEKKCVNLKKICGRREKKILYKLLSNSSNKTKFLTYCIENHENEIFKRVVRIFIHLDDVCSESEEELSEIITEMEKNNIKYKIVDVNYD